MYWYKTATKYLLLQEQMSLRDSTCHRSRVLTAT